MVMKKEKTFSQFRSNCSTSLSIRNCASISIRGPKINNNIYPNEQVHHTHIRRRHTRTHTPDSMSIWALFNWCGDCYERLRCLEMGIRSVVVGSLSNNKQSGIFHEKFFSSFFEYSFLLFNVVDCWLLRLLFSHIFQEPMHHNFCTMWPCDNKLVCSRKLFHLL